ncbi:MAG: hypothetical protein QY322_01980 [bacterium]|nr:MAG: hypothetical protein QY322_01980 [bacterium]
MQENQTPEVPVISNPEPEVSVPQVVNPEPVKTKGGSFLVSLLSILLILATLMAGFFAYQTQQLVTELRMKNEELINIQVTPEPTMVPSPSPTAESSDEPTATVSAEVVVLPTSSPIETE